MPTITQGPYAFPFSLAASCAFEKSDKTNNSKTLPVPAGATSIAPPAAAAAPAASAHTEEEPNPEHPSLSLPAGAMLEADAESKNEGVAAAAEVMAAAGAMELEAGRSVRAVGGDVRQAVRASLALGTLFLSLINLIATLNSHRFLTQPPQQAASRACRRYWR